MVDTKAGAAEFRALFERQYPMLYCYLSRASGDPALADDIAQEAFVRLYQREEVPDDAAAWLVTVATNLLQDVRRRTARQGRILDRRSAWLVPESPVPSPDAAVLSGEQVALVRRALDRLAPREQQLLLLRHEGYSYREIAVALAVAETSVGTLLIRATAAFRAVFEEARDASR